MNNFESQNLSLIFVNCASKCRLTGERKKDCSVEPPITDTSIYYSTTSSSRDAHIWSRRPCYPLSVHNRHAAIYVGCNQGVATIRPKYRKALHNNSIFSGKILFVDNLLNNKTIVLLNVADYRLILADEAVFRRIVVKYRALSPAPGFGDSTVLLA